MTTAALSHAHWARGLAVAAVTVPGVIAAQLVTAGTVPSLHASLVVAVAVAVVACAVPTRTAPATAGVAALAQLAGHAALAVTAPGGQARTGCLSVVGRGAGLGVRYALVRDAACPPGSLAAAPALTAVVAALAVAALVLLGHALLAALTGLLVAVAVAGVDAARRFADAVLPRWATPAGVRLVPAGRPALQRPEPPALTPRWRPVTALRRGPPVTPPATT
ncbi:MAG TPA: hypothetical protein VMT69_01160 [Kineosporiaceae bacterium]|nr:hypothetical protein [Kineosporiaceae bacterium]